MVNEAIWVREVRLVDENGEQMGIVPTKKALELARERELDLVTVAPQARPPVCKLMDYGRYKYEQSKRDRESRRKQHVVTLKEVQMRPQIDEHDYQVKLRNTIRFLEAKAKVKLAIRFRGRQITHTAQGKALCDRVAADVGDLAVIEKPAKVEGRNMIMILAPKNTN